MQDRVDFSHSRCSPCPAAWLGWPRVPGVVRNKQRHQGVALLSFFLLEDLVTVPISSSLSPNTCQPAPIFHLQQAFQHRVPGDHNVCPDTFDGRDGGVEIEVCESLHHVCDALAPCPCGWYILVKCRGCFSLLWRPAALLCVLPSDAECHRPRFISSAVWLHRCCDTAILTHSRTSTGTSPVFSITGEDLETHDQQSSLRSLLVFFFYATGFRPFSSPPRSELVPTDVFTLKSSSTLPVASARALACAISSSTRVMYSS